MSIGYEAPFFIPTAQEGVFLTGVLPCDHDTVMETIGLATQQNVLARETEFPASQRMVGVWDTDTLVGAARFTEKDSRENAAQLEFWTHPEYTSCGYATLAVSALTEHLLHSFESVDSVVSEAQPAAARVLLKSHYTHIEDLGSSARFAISREKSKKLPVAVIKMRATNGSEGTLTDDSTLDTDPSALDRIIKKYAGAKNKVLQQALHSSVDYLRENPLSPASEKIQSLQQRQPYINGRRIPIFRFKPYEAPNLNHTALRRTRIIYGLVDIGESQNAVSILDILHREDMARKYT